MTSWPLPKAVGAVWRLTAAAELRSGRTRRLPGPVSPPVTHVSPQPSPAEARPGWISSIPATYRWRAFDTMAWFVDLAASCDNGYSGQTATLDMTENSAEERDANRNVILTSAWPVLAGRTIGMQRQ
ncbi:hypothetical protein DSL92_03770 [Billgrantia gudaonensis]|uniref:Uncharacterized protein n=1 Tax=Billgrantia gudaonensis TaxID=376427 RepID=A0A3S0QG32_9GAMM|nr:hypothetical protein DSL92_03770 [Halomonas gudaonensis]